MTKTATVKFAWPLPRTSACHRLSIDSTLWPRHPCSVGVVMHGRLCLVLIGVVIIVPLAMSMITTPISANHTRRLLQASINLGPSSNALQLRALDGCQNAETAARDTERWDLDTSETLQAQEVRPRARGTTARARIRPRERPAQAAIKKLEDFAKIAGAPLAHGAVVCPPQANRFYMVLARATPREPRFRGASAASFASYVASYVAWPFAVWGGMPVATRLAARARGREALRAMSGAATSTPTIAGLSVAFSIFSFRILICMAAAVVDGTVQRGWAAVRERLLVLVLALAAFALLCCVPAFRAAVKPAADVLGYAKSQRLGGSGPPPSISRLGSPSLSSARVSM